MPCCVSVCERNARACRRVCQEEACSRARGSDSTTSTRRRSGRATATSRRRSRSTTDRRRWWWRRRRPPRHPPLTSLRRSRLIFVFVFSRRLPACRIDGRHQAAPLVAITDRRTVARRVDGGPPSRQRVSLQYSLMSPSPPHFSVLVAADSTVFF